MTQFTWTRIWAKYKDQWISLIPVGSWDAAGVRVGGLESAGKVWIVLSATDSPGLDVCRPYRASLMCWAWNSWAHLHWVQECPGGSGVGREGQWMARASMYPIFIKWILKLVALHPPTSCSICRGYSVLLTIDKLSNHSDLVFVLKNGVLYWTVAPPFSSRLTPNKRPAPTWARRCWLVSTGPSKAWLQWRHHQETHQWQQIKRIKWARWA